MNSHTSAGDPVGTERGERAGGRFAARPVPLADWPRPPFPAATLPARLLAFLIALATATQTPLVLAVFIALATRARDAASNEAIELLREALTLVHGEPFDDGGYEWADATQDNVQTHDHILNAARDLYRLASDADDLTTARFAVAGRGEVDVVVRRVAGADAHQLTCSARRASTIPGHEVVEVRAAT